MLLGEGEFADYPAMSTEKDSSDPISRHAGGVEIGTLSGAADSSAGGAMRSSKFTIWEIAGLAAPSMGRGFVRSGSRGTS